MKFRRLFIVLAIGAITLPLWHDLFEIPNPEIGAGFAPAPTTGRVAPLNASPLKGGEHRKGPDRMREFFARWHEPYGAVLPPEVEGDIWAQIKRLPDEDPSRETTEWQLVGPSGMVTDAGALYSGRVLDLNLDPVAGTRVAAASGGLWDYHLFTPIPLTDRVTSQWIGSVDVHPMDENTIIIGTGEFWVRSGTGVWKSTDGGTTWNHKSADHEPSTIFRIRYGPFGNVVHMAADSGYYRSTDGGETWTRILTGTFTDIAIHPWYSEVLYATKWDEGLYRSYDAGLSWYPVIDPNLPWGQVKRGAVTLASSDPGVIYVAFAYEDADTNHVMKGVYRSGDFGETWLDVSPPINYMSKQGWYNNVIAVSPTDHNLVLAGGVRLMRTTDGGATWDEVLDDHLHVDYHALEWHESGVDVWAGHDGGWSHSSDHGLSGTWNSSGNYLPITQYVNIDAAGYHPDEWIVGGGSQDNGISVSTDGGVTWNFRGMGDGGGFEIWPYNNETLFITQGWHGDIAFYRSYSWDSGLNWTNFNTGIENCDMWYPRIRIGGDYHLYTNSCRTVYRADPTDLIWEELNTVEFAKYITELTVSKNWTLPVVYACIDIDVYDQRLWVKDAFYWSERSNGLVAGVKVRKVVPHPTDNNVCYALMNGLGPDGSKVYRSDSRGRIWINITGDLPNVPLSDLIVDPFDDDILYLGSEYGCYRTLNGGASWERWNFGLPEAVVVTEMRSLDLREMGGAYYIVAGTYGRSIWRREIGGDDPVVSVNTDLPTVPVAILGIHPNPANPAATIMLSTAQAERISVTIHDARGRLVAQLLDEDRSAGEHAVTWRGRDGNGRAAPAGVYFARVTAAGQTVTQKLVLAK